MGLKPMRRVFLLSATAFLALAGCAGDGSLYERSIFRAAVFEDANVRPLTPLAYPVQALSLTSNTAWAEGKEGQAVTIDSKYGMWISVEPELQAICRKYPREQVVERLHYLLGLKPAIEADRSARFVRFTVKDQQPTGPTGQGVFRPCADPDPKAAQCGNQIKGTADYVNWFANQQVFSYQVNGEMKRTGYPWTRLGYTYNWDPAATDIRGVQEYIVPDKTVVTVTEIVKPEDYCGR